MRIENTTLLLVLVTIFILGCELTAGQSPGGAPGTGTCDCSCESPDDGRSCPVTDACPTPVDTDGDPAPSSPVCIEVIPQQIKFGGKKVGDLATLPLEIRSCGEADLEIRSIELTADSDPGYGLSFEQIPHEPSEDDPLVLPPGASATVLVTWLPECPEPPDENGYPTPEVGTIIIRSNAEPEEKLVEVSGFGALVLTPTPVITCAEGNTAAPWTELHLSGEESYGDPCSDGHEIKQWRWAVSGPMGSQARFEPSDEVSDPTFRVDLAGKYLFHLVVYDEQNVPSCAPVTWEVVVVPDQAIWIELFWETPGDPDETDTGPEAGADLDLHLQRPGGWGWDHDGDGEPECWADPDANCFWFSPTPDWWEPGPQDDPEMVVSDYDGAGPELIGYANPAPETYLVGVHVHNDHGFGESLATVRIYVQGQLVFEVPDVPLVDSDLWTVVRIEWPSGAVTPCYDGPAWCIMPGYETGIFQLEGTEETCGPF